MSLLQPLGNDQGWVKAGFLGFQKSGKTTTATKLAIGTRAYFGLTAPIAFFDTESGSGYVAEMVKKETGTDLLGCRSRSFTDLMAFLKECQAAKVSVVIIDSVTHPWRELCDAFLLQVNAKRKERKLYPLQKLEFQHWAGVKGIWQEFSDFFLNSPMHIIVAGRAGFEYEMETNDETNRKELVKTGVKMRVEAEFGFESSLLIEMEREQEPDGNGGFRLRRRATIIGDRFGVIDGKTCLDPTFDFFLPHISRLKAGAHAPVDTTVKTETGADEGGDTSWQQEKKKRTTLWEDIKGELDSAFPSRQGKDVKGWNDMLFRVFGTRSTTAVEAMDSQQLDIGLGKIRDILNAQQQTLPA